MVDDVNNCFESVPAKIILAMLYDMEVWNSSRVILKSKIDPIKSRFLRKFFILLEIKVRGDSHNIGNFRFHNLI